MKRVVLAALVAAAGVIVLGAPAQGYTSFAAVMANGATPGTYKFAHGVCGTTSGDGNFTIQVGDQVTWTNCTQTDHTVTGDSFGDETHIPPGGSYSYTFPIAKDYPYHCAIHTSMTGVIHVMGEATTTTEKATTTTQAVTTTSKPTTTTTSTTVGPTTTTEDINGVFGSDTTPTEPTTTLFTTDTTRALGQGGSSGTSAGVVAGLIVGLGAIGTAAALVIRKMRAGASPP